MRTLLVVGGFVIGFIGAKHPEVEGLGYILGFAIIVALRLDFGVGARR